MGRSNKWIQQLMPGQKIRNKLTDYWKEHGVEEFNDFAKLTNIIHQEWTGLSVKDHKKQLSGIIFMTIFIPFSEKPWFSSYKHVSCPVYLQKRIFLPDSVALTI